MKIHTIIILLLLIAPLKIFACDEKPFLLIFNKYNEALKSADIEQLEKYLVNVQVSVWKECLDDPVCGKTAITNMKNDALSQYTITNFVEYGKGSRILKMQNENAKIDRVSGPAVQLYYEGIEVRDSAGKGHATFIVEDGVWKISMNTWRTRQ